ncbi:MAG: ArdC-like ssDNA-binding domain-containing protein [Fimbriimonadaceae bacterium]|nr:ArdC-like ssDNA-binding domain-containing protein [Fimbriimonadaceae bacterium]
MQKTSEATQMAADYLACLGNELAAGSSETLVRYLQAMAKFYRYSFYNCCLIAVQRPNATRVAGYKRWKEMGRHVRAGEKGIMILVTGPPKTDQPRV